MNILKALIAIAGGDGSLFKADVIKYQKRLWLVPTWTENPTEGYKTPERIVCLDFLKHQKAQNFGDADFVVNDPIPKAVLYGPGLPAPKSGYRVVIGPNVRFPIPRGIH